MVEDYEDRPAFYPNPLPHVEVENKPEYDIVRVPYYHRDGDDEPLLCMSIFRKCYAYVCAIYEVAATHCVATDTLMFQIFQRNFIILFNNNDDSGQRRTTRSRL